MSLVGETIAGRYKLQEVFVEQELGPVYDAIDLQTQSPLRIKLVDATEYIDPARLQRFGNEMMATATMEHENCVRMLDFGQDGIHHYLLLEHFECRTLRQVLDQEGPFDARRAARIGAYVAAVLAAAHAEGIAHRNLSSQAVLIGEGDAVKVSDFGLARLDQDAEDPRLTVRGTRVGTPAYMAPEYVAALVIDPRGDLYALGILLFEMLVGQPPFTGENKDVLKQQQKSPAPLPSAVNPSVPRWMDRIVDALLQKKPEDRPPDADTVFHQLWDPPEDDGPSSSVGKAAGAFALAGTGLFLAIGGGVVLAVLVAIGAWYAMS